MNYDDIPEIDGFKKIPLGQARDYCNQKFGKLTTLYKTESEDYKTKWVFKCECGNIVKRDINVVRKATNPSCGCLYRPHADNIILNGVKYNIDLNYNNNPEIKGFKKLPLGKAKNHCGERFGKLTAIYRTETRNKNAIWVCKCDCGNIVARDIGSLIIHKMSSCGCGTADVTHISALKRIKYDDKEYNNILEVNGFKKIPIGSAPDLRGQKFNRLTPLYRTENINKRDAASWVCKCDCGNITSVVTADLICGKVKSCGCYAAERKSEVHGIFLNSGDRFGRLTVIELAKERDSQGGLLWKCQCDCGTITTVSGNLLRKGWTQSCGCLQSRGEEKTSSILIENNIKFIKQKTFSNCYFSKTNRPAFFDFFVDDNYLIEYDGEQHFKGWGKDKDNLKIQQQHDAFKNQWCKDNNIPLIRIPYTAYNTLCIDDLKLETTKYRVV